MSVHVITVVSATKMAELFKKIAIRVRARLGNGIARIERALRFAVHGAIHTSRRMTEEFSISRGRVISCLLGALYPILIFLI